MSTQRATLDWLIVFGYAAGIFILSSSPNLPAPIPFAHADKLYHLVEYGVFGFLIVRALYSSREKLQGADIRMVAVIIALFYAVTDELHQYFVPGRTMELMDILSDGVGATIGQLFFKIKGQ